MTPHRIIALASFAFLAACPGDDTTDGPNPPRLWLTLDGSEVQVKLSPVEPPVF